MNSLIRRSTFAMLLLSAPLTRAIESQSVVGFDCWISPETKFITYYIRCIADRDLPPFDPSPETPEQAHALDTIHRVLHDDGPTEELDRLLAMNGGLIRQKVAAIRIYSYPSEWSWQEENPQALARMLCPEGSVCSVFVRRN
jgi:hypothetical protein